MELNESSVWVFIPTYNEAENIRRLTEEIFALRLPRLHVLVVDDQSPDGTGEAVRSLQQKYPSLHLLIRSGKKGRGLAGKDGYVRCLQSGADVVLEMDADFSHPPKDIPHFLAHLGEADILIGSRFVPGGQETGRSLWRRILTRWANHYARWMLRLSVRDCNSGFRCFRKEALEKIDARSLESQGPSIIHEVLDRAGRKGLRMAEIPITFTERKRGRSKLNLWRLFKGYLWILKLRWNNH